MMFRNNMYLSFHCFRYTDSTSLGNWITTNLIYPDGGTATAAGLTQAINDVLNGRRGDRSNIDNVVVIITDGIPTIPSPNSNAR